MPAKDILRDGESFEMVGEFPVLTIAVLRSDVKTSQCARNVMGSENLKNEFAYQLYKACLNRARDLCATLDPDGWRAKRTCSPLLDNIRGDVNGVVYADVKRFA